MAENCVENDREARYMDRLAKGLNPAWDRASFMDGFFKFAQVLRELDGAGIVIRTNKYMTKKEFQVTEEELIAEAVKHNWRLYKVNDQYLGYSKEKNKKLTIEILC